MSEFRKPGGAAYADRYERWSHADTPSSAEDLRIQLEIARTMRAMLAKETSVPEPSSILPKEDRVVAPSKSKNGWLELEPARPPAGQDLIQALTDAALPHGPQSPLRKK
jgi:hypothetical protein